MRASLKTCFWTLAFAILISPITSVQAGPISSEGTEFWLAFPNQYQFGTQTLDLFILSQTGANGQISIPSLSLTQPFSVAPHSAVTLVMPAGAMLTATDGVQDLGMHVISDNPVGVIGLEYEQYTSDGYLGLPVGAIGTQYWVASYTADIPLGAVTTVGSSEFAVVASQDSTTLTITPSIAVGSHAAGVPYTVAVNQGQVYQLQAQLVGDDLTGTQVVSNNPVALFGANACTDIPVSFVTCNTVLEQELPLATWGTAFVTVPLTERQKDIFRYLASANGTVVSVNGTVAATLNQGQFFEQVLSAASYITSSAPILVMQYSVSHTYDGSLHGDPSEITVPPISDYGTAYQLSAPAPGFPLNYLNVAAPNASVSSILLDGSALPAAWFDPVGTSGFSAAQVTIGTGYHQISGPQPFGVESYGFDVRDGYGYPGGLVFTTLPTLTPTPTLSPTITPTPVCQIKVWPDPYNPQFAHDHKLKMDCLQANDKVSIYTLAGELVQQVLTSGELYEWDGLNREGSPVASGVYFYSVERNGSVVKRDKFILIRH